MATNTELLPRRSEPDPESEPAVVSISDAGATFDVLGSRTAREILAALYDEPGTASDVAEETDSSLQNVAYHLENLREAALIETVDTWYSPKGREMDVFAPTGEPLLLYAGETSDKYRLKSMIDELTAE